MIQPSAHKEVYRQAYSAIERALLAVELDRASEEEDGCSPEASLVRSAAIFTLKSAKALLWLLVQNCPHAEAEGVSK